MNTAIIGYATEGKVSAEYFQRLGHTVTICDQKPELVAPQGFETQLGDTYLENLARFDLIVRTAGIPSHAILEHNPGVEVKITTAVNEFLAACPTKNVVGITGTKGKGTTSTLTAKMLKAAGRKVWLGGNIGNSPLEFIDQIQPDDWVVLELSSFQLSDLRHSPHIAVCLMVVPEHLNWHTDMADYVAAKSNLFARQTHDDVAVYFAENATSQKIASHGDGKKLPFFAAPGAYVDNNQIIIDGEAICATSELALLGHHNWQNACAAVTAVWQAGVHDLAAIRSVVTTFSGLEHRLELVRTMDGVQYYDDSFGTTPETAMVAVQAFDQPKIIILGGSDKGASYDQLAEVVSRSNVRKALLIGNQAPKIQLALEKAGFTEFLSGGNNMEDIVKTAHQVAQPGDVVLLSTGCASFDMFADYKDRANQFTAAVQMLA